MNEIPELDLIQLAKCGDESAFMELVTRANKKCRPMLQSQFNLQGADLDDISQITSCKAWNRITSFRAESSFITWFYIIFRNEALNFVKKRNAIQTVEIPAHLVTDEASEGNDYEHVLTTSLDDQLHETALTVIEKQEAVQAYQGMLQDVLNKLSPQHSQIISMALKDERSYDEIAKELQIPIGTVMSRLYYARSVAQKLIKKYAEQHNLKLAYMG
jgi:RNA polymerase sigma-70 factor (ECF subfamily)